MRISRDELFMEFAKLLSLRSICNRSKVGCVAILNNRVVSMGYNGPPSGVDHCCNVDDDVCTQSIHAEMNAIAWAARLGISLEGATLYVTMSPCLDCAKVIINSGVKKVVFNEMYRKDDGIRLLNEHMVVEEYEKVRTL